MAETEQADLTTLTVQLLSAYVSNNSVPANELADLIETTRTALSGNTAPKVAPAPEFEPAVSVRKSTASRDHLVSLIDGKPYKSLKRHLSSHGLTPAEYRERYKLPKDYPMVAPAYSEARREVAQRLGLGRRRAVASAEVEAAPPQAEAVAEPKIKAPGRKATVKTAAATPDPVTPDAAVAETPAAAMAPVKADGSSTVAGRKQRTKAAASDTAPPSEVAVGAVSPPKASRGSKGKAAKTAPVKPKRSPKTSASAVSTAPKKLPARRSRQPAVAPNEAVPAAEAVS